MVRPDRNELPDTATASDTIIYPIDLLRKTAAKILVDADLAQQEHQAKWHALKTKYIDVHDLDGKMAAVLNIHEKRMSDSYNWQMKLAQALFDAISQMETADQQAAKGFKPDNSDEPPAHGRAKAGDY